MIHIKRLTILCAALITGLLISEVLARVILSDIIYTPAEIQPDNYVGWKTRPYAKGHKRDLHGEFDVYFELNSLGYHDVNHKIKSKKNVKRILFIGDSFTEGSQLKLENIYPRKVETLANKNLECINMGMAGYGTDQQLATYHAYGRRYSPEIVVSTFTTENDVHNNILPEGRRIKPYYGFDANRNLVLLPFEPETYTHKVKFLHKSYIYTLKRMAAVQFRSKMRNNVYILNTMRKLGFWKNKFIPAEFESFSLKPENPERWDRGWDITKAIYTKMDKDIKRDGGKLLVVIFPTSFQIHESDWDRIKRWYADIEPENFDLNLPNYRLKEFLKKENIHYLDITAALKSHSDSERLFFINDRHPNISGHNIAAEEILKYLNTQGWL